MTWPFPALYCVVKGASPEKVVLNGAAGLLLDFLDAAANLVAQGADAITNDCVFLALFQKELAAHVRVPLATSSLMRAPWVRATLPPGKRDGVASVSARSLTPAHLEAAGVPLETPIAGTEIGREFFRVLILGEKQDLDVSLAARDILDAACRLTVKNLDIGAIVLECTNMRPYAHSIQSELGPPVFDIYSLITWLHAGLRPRDFGGPTGSR